MVGGFIPHGFKRLLMLIVINDRYTGRPSPYYNESHVKLRDFVRRWVEDVRSFCFLVIPSSNLTLVSEYFRARGRMGEARQSSR